MSFLILEGATATNSAPSAATDGINHKKEGMLRDKATVFVESTAGSGTMTVTIKLWGYNSVRALWAPLGTDPDKGVINGGSAIAEEEADTLQHMEILEGLSNIDRIYAEVTTIGGTSTAVNVGLM